MREAVDQHCTSYSNTYSRAMTSAVVLFKFLQLPSTVLSNYTRAKVKDLPLQGRILFNAQTEDVLHIIHKNKLTVKTLGITAPPTPSFKHQYFPWHFSHQHFQRPYRFQSSSTRRSSFALTMTHLSHLKNIKGSSRANMPLTSLQNLLVGESHINDQWCPLCPCPPFSLQASHLGRCLVFIHSFFRILHNFQCFPSFPPILDPDVSNFL